jgi:DNA-binding XRE family transcriptional regulator
VVTTQKFSSSQKRRGAGAPRADTTRRRAVPISLDVKTAVLKENEALLRRLQATVRTLRMAAGLTLKAAGELAEMNWRHWQKIEAGDVNVTMATLVKVARALRVDVADLFGEPMPPEGGSEPS